MKKSLALLILLFSISNKIVAQDAILTLLGHEGNINSLQFSPDGKYLLSGSQDNSIKVWNTSKNFTLEKTMSVSSASITCISFNKTGTEYAFSSLKNFVIVKYPDFKKAGEQKKAHTTFVKAINFSKDGTKLVSTSWRDNSLVIWNRDGLKKNKILVETEWTDQAIFINNDTQIASANHSNTVKIWDVESGNLVRTLAGHRDWVYGVFETIDGNYIVTASLDNSIKVWDKKSGKLFKTIDGAHSQGLTAMVLSNDGQFFATTGMDGLVKLWNAKTFEGIAEFKGHTAQTLSVAFSIDNHYLASGSSDKTIKIWDINPLVK
jgi:WD40 repeat protein